MTKREVTFLSSPENSSVSNSDESALSPPPPKQQQQGRRGERNTNQNHVVSDLIVASSVDKNEAHFTIKRPAAAAAGAAMTKPQKKDAPKASAATATTSTIKNASSFRAAPPPRRKRTNNNVPPHQQQQNSRSSGGGASIIRPGATLLLGGCSSGSSNKNSILQVSTLSLRNGPPLQQQKTASSKSAKAIAAATTSTTTTAVAAPRLRSIDSSSIHKKKKQNHYLLEDDDGDDDDSSSSAKKTSLKNKSMHAAADDSSSNRGSSDSEVPYTQNLGLPEQAAKLKAIRFRNEHDKKTEPLRPGDVIAYSNPIFVAGTHEAARVAQVLSTNPDNVEMPLELDNAECLPADLRVKRVKEYNRRDGKLYDHPGVFRPINHFRLRQKSLPTLDGTAMTGFRRQVERVQEVMAAAKKEMAVIPEHLVKEVAAASRARSGVGGAAAKNNNNNINNNNNSRGSGISISSDCHANNGNASSDQEAAAPLKEPIQNGKKKSNVTASSNRAGLNKRREDLDLSPSSDSELEELLKKHSTSKSQTRGQDKAAETTSNSNRVLRTVGNSTSKRAAEKARSEPPVVKKPAAAGRTRTTSPGQLGDVSTCNGDSSQSSMSSIEATAPIHRRTTTSQSAAKATTTTTKAAAAPLSLNKKYNFHTDSTDNDDDDGDQDDDDDDGTTGRFKTPLGRIGEKTSARGGAAATFSLSKMSTTSARTRTARAKASLKSSCLREANSSLAATSAASSVKERGKTVAAPGAKATKNKSKDERMSAFSEDDSKSDDSMNVTKTISVSAKGGRSAQNTQTRPPLKDEAATKKKRKSSFGVKEAAIRVARGLPPKSNRDDDDDEFSFKLDDDDHHSMDASSLSSQSISKEKKQKRAKTDAKGKNKKNGSAAAGTKEKGNASRRQQQQQKPQRASHFCPQKLETNNDHVYGDEMDSSDDHEDSSNNYPKYRKMSSTAMRTSSSTVFSRRATSHVDHSSIGSSFDSSQSSIEGRKPVRQRNGHKTSPGMSRLARLSTAARNGSSSSAAKPPVVVRRRPMMLDMQSTSCLDDIF